MLPIAPVSLGYNKFIIGVDNAANPKAQGNTIISISFIPFLASLLALPIWFNAQASDIDGTKLIPIAWSINTGKLTVAIAIPVWPNKEFAVSTSKPLSWSLLTTTTLSTILTKGITQAPILIGIATYKILFKTVFVLSTLKFLLDSISILRFFEPFK